MTFHLTLYALVLGASSLVAVVVAAGAMRRRAVPGGRAFALMMWAVVVWSISSGLGCAVADLPAKVLFIKLSFVAAQCVAPLFFAFALQYSGATDFRAPLAVALPAIVPAASIVLAITNEQHHLVWASLVAGVVAGGGNAVLSSYGPFYWVSVPYLAVLDLVGAIALIIFLFRAGRVYRFQTVILVAALVMPWIGELISDVPSPPFPALDTPAVGCAVGGLIILLGLFRYRLLEIVPVARRLVVERMVDGLLVLDEKDRVVDANPVARSIFRSGLAAFGQPVEEMSKALKVILERAEGHEVMLAESALFDDPRQQFELRVCTVRNRAGRLGGRMVILRDVTARKEAEADRERLISELRAALENVKKLSGLLPICSSCKKIRDDKGYWHQVEEYMKEHAEIQFSHGLCPECTARLYPELIQER